MSPELFSAHAKHNLSSFLENSAVSDHETIILAFQESCLMIENMKIETDNLQYFTSNRL
jgi:hypothetical protein